MQQFKNQRKAQIILRPWCRDPRRVRFVQALRRAAGLVAACVVMASGLHSRTALAQNDAHAGQLTMTLAGDGSRVDAIRLNTVFDVSVSGHVARTRLRQSFRNATDQWAEAVYLFPLPDEAAVDHLTLKVGEQLIVGEIQRKQQALQTYREARDKGQKTALLEQQRSNMFTTAVANIAPGETIEIDIEFQQVLQRDGLRYRLRLPLTMTPRYIPGAPTPPVVDRLGSRWHGATDQVPDGNALGLSQAGQVAADSHRLTVNAVIDAGVPLQSVQSRYHKINVVPETDDHYRVTLAGNDDRLDHDFELEWQLPDTAAANVAAFTYQNDGASYASVQVMPPATVASLSAPPRSLTLVIDTSGSMQGVSMAQAKSAASVAVSALRDIDQFNMIEFNSTATQLFNAPVFATQDRRDAAQRWINRLTANGGTEMSQALSMALPEALEDSGFLRQVIFVTDGAVGNEDALFSMIEGRLGDARLFTVGIGSAPNGWFMRKAAESGRGSYTMISALGEVDERMQQLFERLAQPVLTDIRVDWNGAVVEQYPQTVPDLYAGQPVSLIARSDVGMSRVHVSATVWRDGTPEPWQHTLTLNRKTGNYEAVGVLWARAKIATLEEQRRRGTTSAETIDEDIATVAITHHLVSRVTSLVAVDKTPARVAEALRQQRVANLVPYGQRMQSMQAMTRTATPAALQRLLGGALIVFALLGLAFSRRQSLYAARWSA
ncbi:MAG: marine proteobacterial sortase target protein [Pseudomonadota bacterium]